MTIFDTPEAWAIFSYGAPEARAPLQSFGFDDLDLPAVKLRISRAWKFFEQQNGVLASDIKRAGSVIVVQAIAWQESTDFMDLLNKALFQMLKADKIAQGQTAICHSLGILRLGPCEFSGLMLTNPSRPSSTTMRR
jgi:hypothetical protein